MPISPKPPGCDGCPARNSGRGFVPGSGPTTARVALVGQGPGEMEAYQSTPFVGPSGDELNTQLTKAGVMRSQLWVDNVVRCWLPNNRPPTQGEMEHCWREHVGPALRALPHLRVVVPVGLPAASFFLGRKCGEGDVGYVYEKELPE